MHGAIAEMNRMRGFEFMQLLLNNPLSPGALSATASLRCPTSCMAQASLWTGSRSHLLHAVVPKGEGDYGAAVILNIIGYETVRL